MLSEVYIQEPTPFIRQLQAELPGSTEDMIRSAMFDAAREFCRVSLAVRADALETLPANNNELVVADSGTGLSIAKVISIKTADGWPVHARPDRPFSVAQGTPRRFYCPDDNWVVFDSAPLVDTQLSLLVALVPATSASASLPELLFNKYYEAIREGTLGRLYDQPGKPYSSATKAPLKLRRSLALANNARVQADRGETMTDRNWQFPSF